MPFSRHRPFSMTLIRDFLIKLIKKKKNRFSRFFDIGGALTPYR